MQRRIKLNKGDKLYIYVGNNSTTGGNKKTFNGGTGSYNLTLGSNSFIPGFEDQVIGHKVGETFDVTVTFPESYPNSPDLAGKEAVFTCKINGYTKAN